MEKRKNVFYAPLLHHQMGRFSLNTSALGKGNTLTVKDFDFIKCFAGIYQWEYGVHICLQETVRIEIVLYNIDCYDIDNAVFLRLNTWIFDNNFYPRSIECVWGIIII